jgi:hypothetical protein
MIYNFNIFIYKDINFNLIKGLKLDQIHLFQKLY